MMQVPEGEMGSDYQGIMTKAKKARFSLAVGKALQQGGTRLP